MSLYRTSGFRRCGVCERVSSPPFAPGWATADDGSWMCPACCGRLDEAEGERVLALVEAAPAHQPFVNWRRAAIERLCIDMVADLRQMGWRVEGEESVAATSHHSVLRWGE